jgi:SNF family Na+-dependent transporter
VGEGNFLVLKIVGVLICALLLLKMYRHFPRMTVVTASSIVTFYAAVIGWNLSLFFAG